MKAFLEYIAEDIISNYGKNMSRIAVVFPNKRARLFLNDYIVEEAQRRSQTDGKTKAKTKPVWSPAYITISELFRQQSPLTVESDIRLVVELYKTFVSVTKTTETIDHFWGWGERLLEDFDDLDKHMADAGQVFRNLSNIHELDDVSYLTDEQKAILTRFFANFNSDHNSELKERFLRLWSNMADIYASYKDSLRRQGIAYEGMVYRDVAENKDIKLEYDIYLFVGFNFLHESERALMSKIKDQNKARFYWDFDKYYFDSADNEAGRYIKGYTEKFKNAFDNNDEHIYDNLNKPKNIAYISAATEDIQARYVSTWLSNEEYASAGRRTAVVMCNEGLLPTIVHCIPDNVKEVNVTTGFPLQQSPICSLVDYLIGLQTDGWSKTHRCFRLYNIRKVLSHPYARLIYSDSAALCQRLTDSKQQYPPLTDIANDDATSTLFKHVTGNDAIMEWLTAVLRLMGTNAKDGDAFIQECIFRTYTILNSIKQIIVDGSNDAQTNNKDQAASTDADAKHNTDETKDAATPIANVDITTLQKLIRQVIRSATVPFHGEPARGVQVMGVLETRNLDFDNLLILSCNEGFMPRETGDASFIPYNIRKAFGLTTADNRVDIYAYYFYRMIQRATNVTIVYNSTSNDKHTGEMSRYMLQLLVEGPHSIKRLSLRAGQAIKPSKPREIKKDNRVMDIMEGMDMISPTAINRYLRCQLQFYFNNIQKIKEPDSSDDGTIDNRLFGNIFHKATEIIYRDYKPDITPKIIDDILKSKDGAIERAVDEALRCEFFHVNDGQPFTMSLDGMQIINREVIIRYLRRLLMIDRRLAPFTLTGSETDVCQKLTIHTSAGDRQIAIGGRIDRMDIVTGGDNGKPKIRVVDYKTGGAKFTNDVAKVEDIFSTDDTITKKHTDYYLQAMLYSMIVKEDTSGLNARDMAVSPALLFIQHAGDDDYDPTLMIGKNKIDDIGPFIDEFKERLQAVLADMFEPGKPFTPTDNKHTCERCPYRQLCG